MSLRITQSMIFSRSLNQIRRASRGIIRSQEQVASGRRINRPSDNPAAMLRLLPLNSELKNFSLLVDNSAMAAETLNTGASALEEGSSAMSRLKELLVQASNGTVSASDRKSIGIEIEQMLQHMVSIGNSKRGSSYLFGGTRTNTPPFSLSNTASGSRVNYDGSQEDHSIQVAPGIQTTLYSSGERFFKGIDRQATTITGPTGAAATSFSDTGRGFETLQATFNSLSGLPSGITAGASVASTNALGNLSYTYDSVAGTLSIGGGIAEAVPTSDGAFETATGESIFLNVTTPISPATGTFTARADLSLDSGATKTLVDFSQNDIQVRNSLDNSLLNVDVTKLARAGDDRVTYRGTFDVFTVMIEARDALLNKDGQSSTNVQERLQQLIGEVTTAHDALLTGLQELGIRSANLGLLQSRVEGLILTDESTRSNLQDADLAESISEMTQKQFGFQAALQVSARIVQTSLLSFLR